MSDKKILDQSIINTIRALSMDGVQAANSGHPGAPMGLAPVGWTLYDKIMKYNPENPDWLNRDRFVLSAGHASMLLYSLLHLTGYDLPLEDIKNFRQLNSKCAGHPELGLAPGIETTTGPLGQGAATSVGLAIAESWLAAKYNKSDINLIDYHNYAVMGDGCMMEGITSEAASIAGHLGLGKLVWLYDSNDITIEGNTDIAFTEDVAARFQAYGWHVQTVLDANDIENLEKSIILAKEEVNKPSLIIAKTHIGYGSPNLQDSHQAHGAPLGEDEIELTKAFYGMDPKKKFFVSDEIKSYRDQLVLRGLEQEKEWNLQFKAYSEAYPEEYKELNLILSGDLPAHWEDVLPVFEADSKGIASRSSNGQIMNAISSVLPNYLGGSADLGPSNNTVLKNESWYSKTNRNGRNFHFGVREHAMGSIINGLALTGLKSFCSTFMVFTDYMRSSIRMAAIMKLPVTFIYTHDSLFVGEDGPTHQPIEHLASFRAMPGVDVYRPADANEVSALWKQHFNHPECPVLFSLTRQNIPTFDRTEFASADMAAKGGYIFKESDGTADLIIIASGSELWVAVDAAKELEAKGKKVRIVSMPCMELFDRQDVAYKESVLPAKAIKRMAIEAGTSFGWHKYVLSANEDAYVTRDEFGASAPAETLAKLFGFSAENVVEKALKILS